MEASRDERRCQLAGAAAHFERVVDRPAVRREVEQHLRICRANSIVELGDAVEAKAHVGIVTGRSLLADLAWASNPNMR